MGMFAWPLKSGSPSPAPPNRNHKCNFPFDTLQHLVFPLECLEASQEGSMWASSRRQRIAPAMDKLVIRGGTPLLGTIRVSGAKNSALPAMAAALLTEEQVIYENIPQVRDIQTERNLLAAMGAHVELGYGRAQHRTIIQCDKILSPEASYDLVKTMRASTPVLGPLVARFGRARV